MPVRYKGGGGGGSPSGPAGFTDAFSIALKATDTTATPTDADTYAIAYAESDTIDVQTETVSLGFPAGVYAESSTVPTDSNNFTLRVWLANSAGAGVTAPANANGENDAAVATISTAPAGATSETMTSDIGINIPAGMTVTNATYRGWFRSVNTLSTSGAAIDVVSTGALFTTKRIFLNSALNGNVNHLSGSFTYDLFANGIDTLAKLQSARVFHITSDATAGVSPHVLTVDAGYVEITGAFV